MQVGFIGLGRMGANMVRRLVRSGHEVTAYNRTPEVQEAIDRDVPAPIITLSLQARFRSRQDDSYGARILAALRNEFGGHEVKSE